MEDDLDIKFENVDKGLCVICNKDLQTATNSNWICLKCFKPCQPIQHKILESKDDKMVLDMKSKCCEADVKFIGRITCSEKCHENFIDGCEQKFGKFKKIIDQVTDVAYKVSTRDIIEKGVTWKDLHNYPFWDDKN